MPIQPVKGDDNGLPNDLPSDLPFSEADLSYVTEVLRERVMRPPLQTDVVFWSPPEDPDKPSLPYLPGFTTTLHSHHRSEQPRPCLSQEYLETVTQSTAVVNNPPTELPAPPFEAETAELTVTTPIAIGATRGPQIVGCTITLLREPGEEIVKSFQAAAKIYDPLYYNFKTSIGCYLEDCVFEADQDYRNESAAYEHLHKYGGKPRTRTVRLILIELFNAVSLQAMCIQNSPDKSMGTDAFHYPEEYRLEVLARAMDGYVKQLKIGLDQGDFAGRNILLVPNSEVQGEKVRGLAMPRIVLVDYNRAKIREVPQEHPASLPVNPAAWFWGEDLSGDFAGWVPNEWQDGEVQQQWLLDRFNGDDRRHLYHPAQDYLAHMLAERRVDY